MKNILFIFSFVLLSITIYANEESFVKAEKWYRAGEYDKAIKEYESCLTENEISATVYFNIANCHYKKGDYIKANLFYERAKKYNPNDPDILFNQEITRLRLSEENTEIESGVSGWFYTIVNSRYADYWTWLTIILSLAGTLFLFMMYFSNQFSFKRIALSTSLISFAFSFIFFIFSWYQISGYSKEDNAMIITSSAEAKSEPASQSKTVFIIPGGMKVKILQTEKNGWTEISLNSNIGWIKSEELEKI